MFHVSPWTAATGDTSALDLASIPLWAHLKGLPLDLRSLEGLSFAAGLIGEPKETDEFTKNLTDINLAHVKIEANLNSPLPSMIELRRTSGEIYPVEVSYPWVPPTCCHCHQIGHILKDCLLAPPFIPEANPSSSSKTAPKPNHPSSMATTPPPSPPPVLETTNAISTETTQQMDFELDLQEILSPPPPSSPLPLITFSSSPSAASHIVGLAALPSQKPRRPFPFRHKPSFKKPLPPSHKLPLKNPFSILGSLDSSDPTPPSASKKPPLPLDYIPPSSHPKPSLPSPLKPQTQPPIPPETVLAPSNSSSSDPGLPEVESLPANRVDSVPSL